MLETNQINRFYEVQYGRMQKYMKVVKHLDKTFKHFTLKQVPRSKKKWADMLSKLASTSFDHLTKKCCLRSSEKEWLTAKKSLSLGPNQPNWMTSYFEYLLNGVLPDDGTEGRKINIKSPQYTIRDGTLYRKSYLSLWLKCMTQQEGMTILQETHAGEAGAHEGARALSRKIFQLWIYEPKIYKDDTKIIKWRKECQTFAPIQNIPVAPLTSMSSPWPFNKLGIDIVGPFPEALGKVKFLVITID